MPSSSVKLSDKPQGWKRAQDRLRGTQFDCFRCHRVYLDQNELNHHMIEFPEQCPKYLEEKELNKIAFNSVPIVEATPIQYEANADTKVYRRRAFFKFLKHIPTWRNIGKPDMADGEEISRRSREWSVNAPARNRGQVVSYTWNNPRSPLSTESVSR